MAKNIQSVLYWTLARLTGRIDLCVAGLFGAGKSRAAAVMLVGMLIATPSAKVLVVCKENSAARSFLQLVESLKPPEGIRSAVGKAGQRRGILWSLPETRCFAVSEKQVNARKTCPDCNWWPPGQ